MTLKARLYRDGDFESVWPLFEELIRFYEGSDAPSRDRVKAHLKDRVLGEGSAMELAPAFSGGSPVGLTAFAVLHPGPKTTGQLYIKQLFVAGAHRGKGAGRALMKFLARYALEHGCGRLDWTGETTNPGGLDFYRALGVAPATEKVYFRLSGRALDRFARE